MSRERGIWLAAAALGVLVSIAVWLFVLEHDGGESGSRERISSETQASAGAEDELRAERAPAPAISPETSSEKGPSAADPEGVHRTAIDPERSWRGITVDDLGSPVPHAALVYGSGDGRGTEVCGASDEAGRFLVERKKGQASLGAFAKGYEPASARRISLGDEPVPGEEIRLVLQRGGGTLRGIVRDAAGEKIADAEIHAKLRATGGSPPPSTQYAPALTVLGRSDAEGAFALAGVPSAELWVGARAQGFATRWTTAQVPRLGEGYVELLVDAPVSIHGVVKDEKGAPVGDASVFTLPRVFPDATFDMAMTRSDAEGRYELRGVQPGEFRLRASSSAHDVLEQIRFGNAGETIEWNPVLSTGASLRGRLFDLERHAGAGWKILARDPRQRTNPASATTDAEGRFSIGGVKEWGYTLLFNAPGDEGTLPLFFVEDVRPSPEEQIFRVPEETRRLARIRGRVADANGRALPAAPSVRLTREPRGIVEVPWNAGAENFESPPLPPGDYLLRVKAVPHAELFQRVALRGADVDVGTVSMAPGAELRVTLQPSERSEQVFCFLCDDAQRWRWLAKAEGAELVFPRVPAGKYVLRVEPKPFSKDGSLCYRPFGALDRSVDLAEGAVHRERIDVLDAQRVSFEIEAPDDVRSARIEIRGEGDALARSVDVVRYGREALQAAAQMHAGTWRVTAELAGGRIARTELQITDPKLDELKVLVPLRD